MFRKLKSKAGDNSVRNIRQRIDEESESQNLSVRRTLPDDNENVDNVSESTSLQINAIKYTGLSFNEREGFLF